MVRNGNKKDKVRFRTSGRFFRNFIMQRSNEVLRSAYISTWILVIILHVINKWECNKEKEVLIYSDGCC